MPSELKDDKMIFAAKCAPQAHILSAVYESGLQGVEIYLNGQWLDRVPDIIGLGRNFPLRYALHAPADTFQPGELAELASGLQAEVVVFHDILWDDEWEVVRDTFVPLPTRVCVENVATVHQPLKFMRRFGMGFCLDLEHLQMEAGGVYEEEFLRVMKMASHVHMTGYSFGTQLWHSPIHHAPEHNTGLLNLLREANYSGMIVSEARVSCQTLEEFSKLSSFIREWLDNGMNLGHEKTDRRNCS
jgi:hypothetical protein